MKKKASKKNNSENNLSYIEVDTFNPDCLSPKIEDFGVVKSPRKSLRVLGNPCFGPKVKTWIIPSKDLSTSKKLELDVLQTYHIWSDIGKGSYASVKLATHKLTSEKFALKIYRKSDMEDPNIHKNITREIKILKKLNHPQIVKFQEEIMGNKNLYIVMEYIKGITLNNHVTAKAMKRLEEFEAFQIFSQVVDAVEYCHKKNVVHRDIKLENVIIDLNFQAKLIDFGFATCFSNNKKALVFCGSPTYMAPEIIDKQEFFGPPVDVWALGIMLYVMVTGKFPFNSKTEKRVFDKVKKGHFEIPSYISSSCQDLIIKLLQPLPEERLTAIQILNHSWIKSGGGSFTYAIPNQGDNIEVKDDD